MKCKLCNGETLCEGTGLCDTCWELETRIERNPELAQKILDNFNSKKGEKS